jgi:hypothetical protein
MPLASEEQMVCTLEIVSTLCRIVKMLKCEKTARVILITHGSGYITYFIDLKDGTEITIDAVKELSKLGAMHVSGRAQ